MDLGQSCGGFTMITSSSGSMPLQKAFLQSPCFILLPSSAAIGTSNLAADPLRTGACLPSLDQTLCSKFPRATILGLALTGLLKDLHNPSLAPHNAGSMDEWELLGSASFESNQAMANPNGQAE